MRLKGQLTPFLSLQKFLLRDKMILRINIFTGDNKMKEQTKKKAKIIFYSLVAAVLTGFIIANITLLARVEEDHSEVYAELKKFTRVMKIIRENYVEEKNEDTLIEGAIRGMLMSLDPYSSYLSKDEFKEMQIETKGQYGGLGIEITIHNGILTVVAPIEDTPAYRAGIQAGDMIVEIDGKSTKDMTLSEAVKLMRGPKGTKVVLTIMREGKSKPFKVEIVRDIIHIKATKSVQLDDVLYIRLKQFQENAAREILNILKKHKLLNSTNNGKIAGVILDLRNNLGGLLEEAIRVADDFLREGTIVYTKDREGVKNVFEARDDGFEGDFPLIVLVNRGSASASEIVAGALRDNHRALIMGEKTFGKASVQTIFPLEDGAAVRLTTAYYYTPSGELIHGKGIKPDIEARPDENSRMSIEDFMKMSFEERVRKDRVVEKAYELIKAWGVFAKTLQTGSKSAQIH